MANYSLKSVVLSILFLVPCTNTKKDYVFEQSIINVGHTKLDIILNYKTFHAKKTNFQLEKYMIFLSMNVVPFKQR